MGNEPSAEIISENYEIKIYNFDNDVVIVRFRPSKFRAASLKKRALISEDKIIETLENLDNWHDLKDTAKAFKGEAVNQKPLRYRKLLDTRLTERQTHDPERNLVELFIGFEDTVWAGEQSESIELLKEYFQDIERWENLTKVIESLSKNTVNSA